MLADNLVLIDGVYNVSVFDSVSEASTYILENHLDSSSIAVAINPEKIVNARTNSEARLNLVNANILFLDGIGVVKVAERKLKRKVARIPGCDLWLELMKKASDLSLPVFLVGATDDVITETVRKISAEYNANIVGYSSGYFTDNLLLINEIKRLKPKLVTVAMGSPRQEIFIHQAKAEGVTSFMMGVGGTYDVYVGKVKRAPKFFCKIGLEWLYRLLVEPKRIFRQTKLIRFLFLYRSL